MTKGKKALVTGGRGQDGSYLIELLISKGYEVHAQSRGPVSADDSGTVWHQGDLAEPEFIEHLFGTFRPDEIYHLSSLSSPRVSWDQPHVVGMQNAFASHQMFESMRRLLPRSRFYQASSSEMFGDAEVSPQSETTPFRPQNPYAIAKLYAHQMAGLYRERFGLHISSGILFNHESPRRPLSYVSQKICHAAACLSLGIDTSAALDELGHPLVNAGKVSMGNLNVERDFGFAGDYVEVMWRMLQVEKPGDFVIGTGETHSIREFCEVAFSYVGLDWRDHIEVDPRLVRAVDSRHTVADISKAVRELGWRPQTSFADLVRLMVDAQLATLRDAA